MDTCVKPLRKHDSKHMFPLVDTLRLPVFPSLRFRNRTTYFVRFHLKRNGNKKERKCDNRNVAET